MRVLAGAGVWGTGRVVTHTGLGWMGGLALRMVLAFNVAELGRTSGDRKQISDFRLQDLKNQQMNFLDESHSTATFIRSCKFNSILKN